jgi:hypothetical protein
MILQIDHHSFIGAAALRAEHINSASGRVFREAKLSCESAFWFKWCDIYRYLMRIHFYFLLDMMLGII